LSTSEAEVAEVLVFGDGGYRFIKAVFQYSGGVAAEPGFAIARMRLRRVVPLDEGFRAIEAHLQSIGRPLAAFCACELRSPAPFSEDGFRDFNQRYIAPLEEWGIYRDGVNPVARTNVCPLVDPPPSPSLYAFSYTVPAAAAAPSFVIAGGGEAPEGRANYRDHIVRRGDVSRDGLRDKIRFVRAAMETRLAALGFSWPQALETQAYTIHDIGALIGAEIVQPGATPGGLTWHFCRPPIVDLEFEMDVRATARESVL
jgi:hypothetical protein